MVISFVAGSLTATLTGYIPGTEVSTFPSHLAPAARTAGLVNADLNSSAEMRSKAVPAGTPWLQVNPNYTQINLEQQTRDPSSVFRYYKKLIALHKNPRYSETLIYGSFEPYLADESCVLSYMRRSPDQTILVLSNYGKETRSLPLPARPKKILLDNCPGRDLSITDGRITLSGYRTVVMELELSGGRFL